MEGIGWFTYHIFSRVVKNHPEIEFYFLFDRTFDTSFLFAENVRPLKVSPQARHPILFKIWFNWSVKRVLKKIKPDIFVSPDGYLSLTTNVKQLAIIHDLNFEHFNNIMPKDKLKFYKKNFPKYARKATRIVTVSETSKKDIVNTYNTPSDKIDVVYNAASDHYFELSEAGKEKTRTKYSNHQPYFVYVGSINPRKNPVRLLQAFEKLKKETGLPHKLVFVGSKMWKYSEFDSVLNASSIQKDVVFTGHVTPEELNKLVSSAMALCFVSYFEGFGIPLVEAMQAKTPIISSNVSVMPEVCGEAALYVNPFDVDDIMQKMKQMATDSHLRQNLIAKGSEQVKRFDWDKSAEKMWQSIIKTIEC